MPNRALDTTATWAGPARHPPTSAKATRMIMFVPPVACSTPAKSMNMKMLRADSSVRNPSRPLKAGIEV